jgi:preprotein translocase subunit SecA
MHAEAGRLERYFFDEDLRQDALYSYALAAPGKVSALHVRQVLVKIDKLADGLSADETELVETALDDLLELHGLAPVFSQQEDETPMPQPAGKPGRNDPCPCGSGKKFKKCCGQ